MTQNNYPAIIQKVHHEFFTSSDRALEAAKQIIASKDKESIDKGKRLNDLGFVKNQEAIKAVATIKELKIHKDKLKYIQEYSQQYPLYKFITVEQVNEICKKYKLVCGPSNQFKGFIPKKNLADIETFKQHHDDELSYFYHVTHITFGNASDRDYKKCHDAIKAYLKKHNNIVEVQYKGKGQVEDRLKSIGRTAGHYVSMRDIQVQETTEFEVCGPKKDFDLTGLKQTGNFLSKLLPETTFKNIPDPVVLRRVKGGYLIVTAWGDEASDPIVVNSEKYN